ncbi:MAG: hypothetical protein ACTSXV_02320 [Alphaproteobacteria bacterium]
MKKILLLSLTILLGACTFYPLGMSEVEWNSLSKQERIEARREEARLREQRQIRYAIERQNRLKEDRINADINATKSTAQAASAAASAAQAASQSASVAQQASQNTSSNIINFNPNIVVSNTNQNDLANISSNTNSQDQSNRQNVTGLNRLDSVAPLNDENVCKQYDVFMKQGKKFFTEDKYKQSVDMYTKAVKRACTDKQKKIAQKYLVASQKALKNSSSKNNGGKNKNLLKSIKK